MLSAIIGSSYALNEGDKPWSHAQIRLVEDSALDQVRYQATLTNLEIIGLP